MDNRQPSLTKPKFVSPLELLKDVKDLNVSKIRTCITHFLKITKPK